MISHYDFIEERMADYQQLDVIEGLLTTAEISPEYSESISRSLNSLTYEEAEKLIRELSEKQVNRIHAGLNYNSTYINNFTKKSI
jgi:hypothetical protein